MKIRTGFNCSWTSSFLDRKIYWRGFVADCCQNNVEQCQRTERCQSPPSTERVQRCQSPPSTYDIEGSGCFLCQRRRVKGGL